jgi:hypothetical protein
MRFPRWGVIVLSVLGAISLGQFLRDVTIVSFYGSGQVTEGSFRGIRIGDNRTAIFRATYSNESRLKLTSYSKDGGAACVVAYQGPNCGQISDADQYFLVRADWYEEWVTVNVTDAKITSINYRRQFIYLDP